jgi:hypothetical protein
MRSGLLTIYGTSGVGKSYLSKYVQRYLKNDLSLISVDDIIHDKFVYKGYISPDPWRTTGKVGVVGSFINSFSTYNEFVEKQDIYHSAEEDIVNSIMEKALLNQLPDSILDTTGSFCNLDKNKIGTIVSNFPSLYIFNNNPFEKNMLSYKKAIKPISYGSDFINLYSQSLKDSDNVKETLEDLFPSLILCRKKIYENIASRNDSFYVSSNIIRRL